MKKINKLMNIIYILAIVLFIPNYSYSDCPPNWYQKAIPVDINGCRYLVEYCYKCDVSGPNDDNIKITYYARLPKDQQPNYKNCDDNEVDFELIKQRVIQEYYNDCIIPSCSGDPPPPPLRVVIEYPLCKNFHNIAWFDPITQKIEHFFWEESCNNTLLYCQIVKYCCVENGEYRCQTVRVVPQGSYESCQDPPTIPPPGRSWDESWDLLECYRTLSCEEVR